MKKELEKIKQSIILFEKIVNDFGKRISIENITPKFTVGQNVYRINNNKVPSWYTMPVLCENIEDGFEKTEIETINIGKGENLGYESCGCGENADKIVVAYGHSYGDVSPENEIWATLSEAIEANEKKFKIERKKYLKQIEEEKNEKKMRLKNELKNLK